MTSRISLSLLIAGVAVVSAAGSPALSASLPSAALHRVGDADLSAVKYFTVNLRPGTTAGEAKSVAGYFRRFGLVVDDHDRRALFVRGTYGQAAAAGSTEFELAGFGDERFVHAVRPPSLPRSLARYVLATSIDDGPPMHPAGASPDFTLLPTYGYTPSGLATYYDAASVYAGGTNGAGQSVALIDCGYPIGGVSGGTRSVSSLRYFEQYFSLPLNVPTIVFVDTTQPPDSAFTTWDIQALVAAAPGATITMYLLPSSCSTSNIADALAKVATDMPTKHYVAITEENLATEDFLDGSPGTLMALHTDIQDITNAGATMFSGSGIWGAGPPPNERQSIGEFTVAYPASDPLVVGVGGTSAIPQSASNPTRAFELGAGLSGGGVSHDFTIPTYQRRLGGIASKTMRNVPDVAYDADINLCAEFFIVPLGTKIGNPYCLGGTFIGGDEWTGFLALVDQARAAAGKTRLANVSAAVYGAATTSGNLLRMTQGCNDYYCAGTQIYNNVTGLGVPDVAKLVSYLVALP